MRIQEMRSGSVHLKKKMPNGEQKSVFEYRDPRELVLPGERREIAKAEPTPALEIECDLDQPFWSVVSFETVEAGGLNYFQASRLLTELEASGIAGLCLTTDNAARKALIG